MRELEKAKIEAAKIFSNPCWVKWVHEGAIEAKNSKEKLLNRIISILSLWKHCPVCLNLNGCCFPENNMPNPQLHPNCHCRVVYVNEVFKRAVGAIEKFEKYVFNPRIEKNKGKKQLFESWGYDIMDSEWLTEEICRQAQEKYAMGDFELGLLDKYGQRINIYVELPRKDRIGTVEFVTGWLVYPNGVIKLTTPLARR